MTYRLIHTPDGPCSSRMVGTYETPDLARAAIFEKGFSILFEEHDADHPGCWDIAATKPGVATVMFGNKRRRIEGAQTLELFAIEDVRT